MLIIFLSNHYHFLLSFSTESQYYIQSLPTRLGQCNAPTIGAKFDSQRNGSEKKEELACKSSQIVYLGFEVGWMNRIPGHRYANLESCLVNLLLWFKNVFQELMDGVGTYHRCMRLQKCLITCSNLVLPIIFQVNRWTRIKCNCKRSRSKNSTTPSQLCWTMCYTRIWKQCYQICYERPQQSTWCKCAQSC